jgi:tight adherence protein C
VTPQAQGAVLGTVFAIGALIAFTRWAATRKPGLAARVAPFIPRSRATFEVQHPYPSAFTTLLALLRPMARAGSRETLEGRLRRAGRQVDCDGYRLEQIVAGVLGLMAGGVLGIMAISRGGPPISVLVLAAFGAGMALLIRDRQLAQQARRRSTRMGQQLPTIAELLAFAVAAGESPIVAIERITSTVTGDLSSEFAVAVGDLRGGQPLVDSLRGVAVRSGSPAVERFVDGLIVSIERGTPLVDVLRAQAADARAADRRALMETAGRKDVLMLVPVVFFVLPTVVLVALFPGFQSLQLVVP